VALPNAICLAKTFGSRLTLLHVMQPPVDRFGTMTTDALAWEISRQEAMAYLQRHERSAAAESGQTVEVRLEQGHPAERIVAIARQVGADLTVVASHGQGGVAAWNLGSTVQQVLAVSRESVFVARSTSLAPSTVPPKRILVPLDGSVRTESVLPTVARIARTHAADVLLVHVVLELLPSALLRDAADLELARELAARLERRAAAYLEGIRDHLASDVPSVRSLVLRHADERQSLLELSQRENIDLVVLSAHGATCNPLRTLGSVAAHMLTYATVPLLVLQDLPASETRHPSEEAEHMAPALRSSHPPPVGA
jgi:nucleotide-binding universal stress UspA family protein